MTSSNESKRMTEILLAIKQHDEEYAEKPQRIRMSVDYFEEVLREANSYYNLHLKEPYQLFGVPIVVDQDVRTFEVY